jgi:hypothetical protein
MDGRFLKTCGNKLQILYISRNRCYFIIMTETNKVIAFLPSPLYHSPFHLPSLTLSCLFPFLLPITQCFVVLILFFHRCLYNLRLHKNQYVFHFPPLPFTLLSLAPERAPFPLPLSLPIPPSLRHPLLIQPHLLPSSPPSPQHSFLSLLFSLPSSLLSLLLLHSYSLPFSLLSPHHLSPRS